MPDFRIRVKGVDKVVERFKSVRSVVDVALLDNMGRVTKKVTRDAKEFAPVDTGFLRDHISGKVLRVGATVTGRIRSTARYSFYQEFGTSRNRPHPYLSKAYNKNIEYIQRTLKTRLMRALVASEFKGKLTGVRIG